MNETLLRRPTVALLALVAAVSVLACPLTAQAAVSHAATVPIELQGVHVFVAVSVNGKPATFVLDTGASANVITPAAAKRLGLSPGSQQTPLIGAAGRAGSVASVKIALLAVGATQARNQVAYVIRLPEAMPCDGLLGTPFLRDRIVKIDYESSKLMLIPKSEFQPPAGATVLPLRFDGNTPFVEAHADGHSGWFRMDTGADNGATLFSAFVESNHLRGRYSPAIRIVTGRGVGGLLMGDLVRLPLLQIGPYKFVRAVAELSRQTEGTFGDKRNAGNIGGEVWQRFTLTLDYADRRAYIEPNSRFDRPFAVPRSGLAIDDDQGQDVVCDVMPGSPGAEAGIVVGDVVTAANGVAIGQIRPSDFTAMLHADPGTRLRLRVQSADKTERDVTITLRDLL